MRNILLAEYPQINYAVLARVNEKDEVHEFVCAYAYDKTTNTWGQGHYFSTLQGVIDYMRTFE